MNKKTIPDKHPGSGTDRKPATTALSREQGAPLSNNGMRRRYAPPRLLSSELLELAAGICDGTTGPGKSIPPCNPMFPPGS